MWKSIGCISTLLSVFPLSILYGGSLVKNLKAINTTTPIVINEVTHPYTHEELPAHPTNGLVLELYHEEANQIVDEEDWFDRFGFYYPQPIDMSVSDIPRSTMYGELKFLRMHNKRYYAIYETVYQLTEAKDIYDEGHNYTLIVLPKTSDTAIAFDLDRLFPDILEMCWFDAVDDVVYFNATYNGYADIREEKTGYLYSLDITDGIVIWATKNLISSYRGFTLYRNHIITGYGFTAEPDFLYVVNRFNGSTAQTIPIKTAHEYIAIKNNRCYVRTYNMNYVYTMQE